MRHRLPKVSTLLLLVRCGDKARCTDLAGTSFCFARSLLSAPLVPVWLKLAVVCVSALVGGAMAPHKCPGPACGGRKALSELATASLREASAESEGLT